MNLRYFLKIAGKYQPDVYGDLTDDWSISYCGIGLTRAGEEKFQELMPLKVDWKPEDATAVIKIDRLPNAENLDRQLRILFEMAAGYCPESEYNKYFIA